MVDDSGPSCTAGASLTPDDIARAETALGASLPESLRRLYLGGDGRYRADGEWWVVWPLSRVVEENEVGQRSGGLSASVLAFGDDGTGNPFVMGADEPSTVLRWSYIDAATVGTEGTVEDFLARWCGPHP